MWMSDAAKFISLNLFYKTLQIMLQNTKTNKKTFAAISLQADIYGVVKLAFF